MTRIRVGIVEDHSLVTDAIIKILEGECEIVGTAINGRDGIVLAKTYSPDILLIDIALPQLNGLDAARLIKRENPQIRIIFVTVQTNREYVREAFEAGASGYVLKQASSDELVSAIQAVSRGRFFVSSLIRVRYVQEDWSSCSKSLKLFSSLTPRQREVLQLVAEGKSGKEISSDLCISAKTVEFHKKILMDELKVKSSAELIRYAFENGFVAQ